MTDNRPGSTQLNDYLDDQLGSSARREVEQWLLRDPELRAELESLRRVRAGLEALPGAIEPEKDLWPSISGRLGGEKVVRSSFRRERREAHWLAGAGWIAAAVSVASLGVLLYGLFAEPAGVPPAAGASPLAATGLGVQEVAMREYRAAESQYEGVVEELTRVLDARRTQLSPDTVAVVEENLAIINDAIEQARAALEADAADPRAGRLFASLYQRKIDLLRQASRLPAGI